MSSEIITRLNDNLKRINNSNGLKIKLIFGHSESSLMQKNEYIITTFLPSSSRAVSNGMPSVIETLGVYQVDVYSPVIKSWGHVHYIADKIENLFEIGSRIGDYHRITIIGLSRSDATREQQFMKVTVSVNYQCLFNPDTPVQ